MSTGCFEPQLTPVGEHVQEPLSGALRTLLATPPRDPLEAQQAQEGCVRWLGHGFMRGFDRGFK